MNDINNSHRANRHDSPNYNLQRFVEAQKDTYSQALQELRNGRKTSHWMWYIFPQLKGLGHSSTAQFYGIEGLGEANAYLAHPILGARLTTCSEVLLTLPETCALNIFGSPDNLKLRSSMTLFDCVTNKATNEASDRPKTESLNTPSLYKQIIDKFYDGEFDNTTLALLNHEG